jgi:hypothetical protein
MTIKEAKIIVKKAGYRIQESTETSKITVYYEIGVDEGDSRPYEEIEFNVIGSVSWGKPATMYDRNGDPGDPEEYDEFEVISITPDPDDYNIDPEIIEKLAEEKFWWDPDDYIYDPSYEDIYDEDDDPEFFRH